MKELVEYIVKSLVDHPDDVSVAEIAERGATVLELSVAREDMGRVIGKGGRVINSIRALVDVQAAKLGQRVTLEIIE
ncbi:MAG: KH domain-containing protein [Ardenticatenaceae bacterium]|nr:KH domain-containing protein [Ardenticatenaceae bacterium]MCB8991226.1 KH domain-containing protein [Ardenticatenaceae bacterium]